MLLTPVGEFRLESNDRWQMLSGIWAKSWLPLKLSAA